MVDYATVDRKDYSVNFGTPSVNDEFASATLGQQWHWERENAANWSLTKQSGALVLTSGKGDLSSTNNKAENVLLQSANTDWTVETKLVCSRKPSGFTQNAGVLAAQDDDNFVKLVYTAGFGRRGMGRPTAGEQPGSVELQVESKGEQKASVSLSLEGIITGDNTLILRLVKKGDLYTATCSVDGKDFKPVGTANIVLKDIQAGLLVCDGVAPARLGGFGRPQAAPAQPEKPFEVAFDYFHITNSGL
jgi:hypothetical protein